VVLSDHPVRTNASTRAVSHLLGECGITFMAAPPLAKRLRPSFPASLDGAPALMPTDHTALRWTLDRWFESEGIRPRIVAEFDDTALIKVFGGDGLGFFAVHSVIAEEISRRYEVMAFGGTRQRTERFYAITPDRKLKHPAVASLATAAKIRLFGH
jgi:LysR family transcriptional regulator, transcriptional activator of nhaA